MTGAEGARARHVALRGQVVTDYEVWPDGSVLLEGGSIRDVSPDDSMIGDADEVHEHDDSLLLPGFVDLQVNGAFGVDVATEPSRVAELSQRLFSTGTTAYLPTVISSPEILYEEVLPELGADGPTSGAEVLGVHLEGPFINLAKRGAHAAAHVVPPDPGLLAHLLDLAPVRMLTVAPELGGADELMTLAANRGAAVSATKSTLGHAQGASGAIEAAACVLAVPGTADDELYQQLVGRVAALHRIGDCVAPRRAHAAVVDGRRGAVLL